MMDSLSRDVNAFPATMDDVTQLLRMNPTAAQQLAAITWHRIALELEAKLAEQSEES